MKKIKNPNPTALPRLEAARATVTVVPSPAADSEPAHHHRDLDVAIELQPRVAGVEKGRIFNHWLECSFEIRPLKVGDGFEWSAKFAIVHAQARLGDSPRIFVGTAKTRALAKGALMDTVTKHIQFVHDDRKLARQLVTAPGADVKEAANKGVFALGTLVRAFADLMRALARAIVSPLRRS